MTKIGSVSAIVRYPVKSMAGESVEAGFLGYSGLFGDRVYAFVQQGGRVGFPWFTIRQMEDLVRYKARLRDPAVTGPLDMDAALGIGPGLVTLFPDEDTFDIEVESPDGERLSVRDPRLKSALEAEADFPLVLRFSERSLCDCRPVSLFAHPTLSALESELGMALDTRRFRANFYVDWDNGEPFYENSLIGQVLQIGERCKVMLTERDPRCKIITIDPETGDADPKILRHVSTAHAGMAGVYGAVLLEGVIRAGDPIWLA